MKKLSKYYSKKAAFLKCPHCLAETHVGHFAWSALGCLNCGAMVNKEDWFLSDWQDAEQSVHPTNDGLTHADDESTPAVIGGTER